MVSEPRALSLVEPTGLKAPLGSKVGVSLSTSEMEICPEVSSRLPSRETSTSSVTLPEPVVATAASSVPIMVTVITSSVPSDVSTVKLSCICSPSANSSNGLLAQKSMYHLH